MIERCDESPRHLLARECRSLLVALASSSNDSCLAHNDRLETVLYSSEREWKY
jgi:hypothetical protein